MLHGDSFLFLICEQVLSEDNYNQCFTETVSIPLIKLHVICGLQRDVLRATPSYNSASCNGTTCLLSASFSRHFSLTVAELRAPLSRFLEGASYKYPE